MITKQHFTLSADKDWRQTNTGKYFLGKEVSITVSTTTDSEDPITEIFDEQIETVNLILADWDPFAKQVEAGILSDGYTSREDILRVVNEPHIWLGMDSKTKRPWPNHKWSVVVGVTESEDFAWHTEFEGTTFLETWAGG